MEQTKKPARTEVKEKVVGYVIAAFSLVGALAWNDAVRALIDTLYEADKNSVTAKFIYAIIISVLVVLVSIYLTRMTSSDTK
jgi:hypothetical protein